MIYYRCTIICIQLYMNEHILTYFRRLHRCKRNKINKQKLFDYLVKNVWETLVFVNSIFFRQDRYSGINRFIAKFYIKEQVFKSYSSTLYMEKNVDLCMV